MEDVTGRYVRVSVPAWGVCDVYYESAGTGTPVILLPTAGSDCGQYHGLMSDSRLTQDFRLITFDLPWHGKSLPPATKRNTGYTLDTTSFTDCIAGFIQALRLDEKPVLVGASMAGAVVIEMAALHPTLVRGVVSSQAGPRVANRHTPWLRNPKINQTLHVPEWTYGLMSPQSPKSQRDRVWWGYSLGGFSVYEQDINYYSSSWDIDRVRHLLDEQSPLAVLMNGIYDYSVPPEATQELQRQVPNSIYREMPELGHFPHAENPKAFAGHLLWALTQIQAHDDRPRPVPTTSGQHSR
jgi:pimeloyl-ACP methyl ester carboxylesterase